VVTYAAHLLGANLEGIAWFVLFLVSAGMIALAVWLSQKVHVAAESRLGIPDILVEYSSNGVKNFLTLINDSEETAYRFSLRTLNISYEKQLYFQHGIPPLQGKHKHVADFGFEDSYPLDEFIRSKAPANAATTAELYYENNKGAGFVREFTLKTHSNDTLIWQPGPIKRQ